MNQKYLLIIWGLLLSVVTFAQTTFLPDVSHTNVQNCTITKIEISKKKTLVHLIYEKTKSDAYQAWVSFSHSTYIVDRITGYKYKVVDMADGLSLGKKYSTKGEIGTKYQITLVFPALPSGTNSIDVIEDISTGFFWKGISINNPDTSLTSDWDEISIKLDWEKNGLDGIEGIYENTKSDHANSKYKLALKKDGENYNLIYLGGNDNGRWHVGDIKAILSKTASPNIYKVLWYLGNKAITENLYITFDTGLMKLIWTNGLKESLYLKLYPTSSNNSSSTNPIKSSGTGFAITSDGYIVTNYHVVDGANTIFVRGVKGNFSKAYNAEVVLKDRNNDLALIRINDSEFTSLGTLPYTFNQEQIDVGSSVYALGYPLRASMGDEVKLTNGIVSSRTGYQGDITTYQVSVPVQPGNSGGPLFNSKGEIVGIINAKHSGAENASYAIKLNYLINLIQAMNEKLNLPKNNTVSNKGLSEQVKFVKEFVYILEVK